MTHSTIQLEAIEAYDDMHGPMYRKELEDGAEPEEVFSGDTLALFVFQEIGDASDRSEAVEMMESASSQLRALAQHIREQAK